MWRRKPKPPQLPADIANANAVIRDLLNQLDTQEAALATLNLVVTRGLAASADPEAALIAERIRALLAQGMKPTAISLAVFGYKGGRAAKVIKEVTQSVTMAVTGE